ncbi:DUF6880 family protein [Sphingobium sp.]|uniref:DUF6880 family protein n=1 Tax=Sphingobium sp. TaxID=1912891 RepID=UPI0028BE7C8A|nr:DUF6880 family protein [Sphingobium sp.]
MASEKTVNVKNLAALGAERLAELLLDLAQGDAPMKRQLLADHASRRHNKRRRIFSGKKAIAASTVSTIAQTAYFQMATPDRFIGLRFALL